MTRPRGEIRLALYSAATAAPGPVRELAARAQVGYAAAQYTATRMLRDRELVVLSSGTQGRVLAAADEQRLCGEETVRQALDRLQHYFMASRAS
jgi:hypothetical protein